ncbi:cullin-5 [Caerostris extrusa]|uniref:Cullin-5 n=1 Tax=Caerostris extrusa TaxID=172846 RepID=A0AAV4U9N2_CAEEX|nr:cullin-5 [Caerostris extrusa]
MCYADQKLKEEEQMGLKYLEPCPGSIQALNECCAQCLINAFKEPILAECSGYIRNNETERLKTMFKIMDHVPEGIPSMQKDLEQHIIQQGQAVTFFKAAQDITNCVKHSEQLLDLFAKYNKLVKEAFNDDPRFLTSRDKVFAQIANDTSSYCLELFSKWQSVGNETQPESCYAILLSHYCDLLLKKTSVSKKLTSDEIESRLKNVILVLKYIQNKDVFMKHYKFHLTRRLILESSVDNEKEENMVEWLRDIFMPPEYVDKLYRMVQDIKVSEDLNQQFKNSHIHKGTFADMNIKILNSFAWAGGTQGVQVSLPLELEQFIPELEDYYNQKHNCRKLLWNHHMSNGTIAFSNKAGKFDLDVTTFQIAVLFAWNERPYDRISFEDLRLATKLPGAELRRTLWSLVNFPKLKSQVLLYGPEVKTPKEFGDSTQFWINQEFSVMENNKLQNRRKLNLVDRLQLYTEKSTEDSESIA